MSLTLKMLDETTEKSWDDLVQSSSHSSIFHTVAWLKLARQHSHADLLPCMFYKGTQLVAIYPIFIQKKGIIKVALSPPSRSYMLYLGPVIADYESIKQDKRESTFIQIQQDLDKYLFDTMGCKFIRIRSSPGLYDSRPLRWCGYTIDPYYTYRIDLSKGIDYIWEQFDRKLRVDIKKAIREGVTVRIGDKEDLEFIHDSLSTRYQQQGLDSGDYKKYLHAIYSTFSSDNVKIFVAEYKGKRIGGTINLCFNNIMYLWVGIPKCNLVGISPNDLIQWEAIKWAHEHRLTMYEEMDAGDDPRLRYFKSKYNPDLVIWYSAIKHSSVFFKAGEKIFNLIKR
jgi:hypothetical protein